MTSSSREWFFGKKWKWSFNVVKSMGPFRPAECKKSPGTKVPNIKARRKREPYWLKSALYKEAEKGVDEARARIFGEVWNPFALRSATKLFTKSLKGRTSTEYYPFDPYKGHPEITKQLEHMRKLRIAARARKGKGSKRQAKRYARRQAFKKKKMEIKKAKAAEAARAAANPN